MDPKALLEAAAALVSDKDFSEAKELLDAYWEWRRRGGFEPRGGDKKAKALKARMQKKTAKKKAAKKSTKKTRAEMEPTVDSVLQILTAHLTQYDKRASSRRGYNPYALGLYFKAVEDVRRSVPSGPLTTRSAQSLKRAIDRYFIVSDMPPAKKTIKNIDEYLGGKPLRYPISK